MSDGVPATSHRNDDPLLVLEDVVAGYGQTKVLQGVSFDIGDGEIVGLVGRNGVGKTTTLRTIMGNLTATSGSISFDGEDITELSPEQTVKRGIALVPEERRIFHGLSVRENLELAEMRRGSDDAGWSIDDVIEMFDNFSGREDQPGSGLSGGEQQMLAIARALVSDARFLLLDEPTEGLAPYIVQRVINIIEELNDQGLTILLVEQNVHMALDVCDYVYVLDNGRVVHDSTAAEMKEDDEILDRYLGVTI